MSGTHANKKKYCKIVLNNRCIDSHMSNNIAISSNTAVPKGEGEIDDATDHQQYKPAVVGGHAWQFNTGKFWIKSIENDAIDYKINIIA